MSSNQVDFQGNPLNENDIVVSTDGGYKHMVPFRVVGFTTKMIRVVRLDKKPAYGASGVNSFRAADKPTLKSPCDVALIAFNKAVGESDE